MLIVACFGQGSQHPRGARTNSAQEHGKGHVTCNAAGTQTACHCIRLPTIAFARLQPEVLAPAALPHGLGVGVTVMDFFMQVMTIAACIGWMGISSALIMINKYIMSTDGFVYPMALSCLGMLFSSVASYLCCRVSHCACLTGARSLLQCNFHHDTWLQRIQISALSVLEVASVHDCQGAFVALCLMLHASE